VLQIAPCRPIASRNNVGRPVFAAYVNVIHNVKCFFLVCVALCASGSASPVTTAHKPHSQCRVPTRTRRAVTEWHWSVTGQYMYYTAVSLPGFHCSVRRDGQSESHVVCYVTQVPVSDLVVCSAGGPVVGWIWMLQPGRLQQSTQHCSAVEWLNWTQWSGLVESVDWASVTVEIWGMCSQALSLFSNIALIIDCKYITYNLYSTTI